MTRAKRTALIAEHDTVQGLLADATAQLDVALAERHTAHADDVEAIARAARDGGDAPDLREHDARVAVSKLTTIVEGFALALSKVRSDIDREVEGSRERKENLRGSPITCESLGVEPPDGQLDGEGYATYIESWFDRSDREFEGGQAKIRARNEYREAIELDNEAKARWIASTPLNSKGEPSTDPGTRMAAYNRREHLDEETCEILRLQGEHWRGGPAETSVSVPEVDIEAIRKQAEEEAAFRMSEIERQEATA